MALHLRLLALSSLFLLQTCSSYRQSDCSRSEYETCVRIAGPLIKEPHMVFPDNMDDIDVVCRTWNSLVDCLKRYTELCFTEDQRRQFNKAVENPIESVHQMCMHPQYQKEYLQHATCIKSTITEKSHCGPQYSLLVDQVAQGEVISKSVLCCSYDRFKQCVQQETRRLCDRGLTDGPAARFATQTIEKAHSFFHEQCFNYIPNSGDCGSLSTDALPFSDPFSISTSSSEVSSWSTVQDISAKEALPDRMMPPKGTPIAWLPSSTVSEDHNAMTGHSVLGSRTRPASYGRSSSWMDGNQQNTVQMSGGEATPTPPPNQERATLEPRFLGKEPWFSRGDGAVVKNCDAGAAWASDSATSEDGGGDVTGGDFVTTAVEDDDFDATMADEADILGETTKIHLANTQTEAAELTSPVSEAAGSRLGYQRQVVMTSSVPTSPPTATTAATTRGFKTNSTDSGGGNSKKNSGDDTRRQHQQTETPPPPTMTSSETWYPAAGNQLLNEVDEPNQQGLKKMKNSAEKTTTDRTKHVLSLTVIATVLTAYC